MVTGFFWGISSLSNVSWKHALIWECQVSSGLTSSQRNHGNLVGHGLPEEESLSLGQIWMASSTWSLE